MRNRGFKVCFGVLFYLMPVCLAYGVESRTPLTIQLMPPGNNLENKNQIEVLCPPSLGDSQQCRIEKLSPKEWYLNVYEKPDFQSPLLGKIRVVGTPGKGMSAEYLEKGKKAIEFPSDSKGTDWGYSCYFEFSVSDAKGDWIQLPKRPFSTPVWIHTKKDWPKQGDYDLPPRPRPIDLELVYSVGKLGNIVITKISKTDFTYRKENANDTLCGEDPKEIPASERKELQLPLSELYDKDGHLIAWPSYCRGC